MYSKLNICINFTQTIVRDTVLRTLLQLFLFDQIINVLYILNIFFLFGLNKQTCNSLLELSPSKIILLRQVRDNEFKLANELAKD
jgi:hypothetical protein